MKTVDFFIEHTEYNIPMTASVELIDSETLDDGRVVEHYYKVYTDGTERGVLVIYEASEVNHNPNEDEPDINGPIVGD